MPSKFDKIFIQIPSYRDSQLIPTIESLLENATYPERLEIWVCWQHTSKEKIPANIKKLKNIHIIDVNYKKSKGAGWARRTLQKKWNNEPYSLLVDSHTRFVKSWDKKLINMMLFLKTKSNKPIISTLPPPFYDPLTYPKERLNNPLKIFPKEYASGLLTRFHGYHILLYKLLKNPIPAEFIAMGFLFTEGNFNLDIPFDPNIYFFGDDITTALRAYTHGYDFFHPHRIIAWHLYSRASRIPHWEDNTDWYKIDKKSYRRVLYILKGGTFEKYTMGTVRKLIDFEIYIGHKLVQHESD
jgi:Glycosyltransferase (GlcNAc)